MKASLYGLVIDGKTLLERVKRHETGSPDAPPLNQRVMPGELDAWYRGVESFLEKSFGPHSFEIRTWRFRREQSVKRCVEAGYGGVSADGEIFVAQLLAESVAILSEIKATKFVSRSAKDVSLRLSSLHPKIVESCTELFAEALYDLAVSHAFRIVEDEVRRRSNSAPTDAGTSLISKAMSGKSAALRFRSLESEQEALQSLFRGAIGAFKSSAAQPYAENVNGARVLELLAFASLLMHMLDAAEHAET